MTLSIITEDQRDPFGQYMILPGHSHSLPFIIPTFGSITLTIQHALPNSQDLSLDMWLTTQPLDNLVLQVGVGHHKAKRRPDQFTIHCEYLRQSREDDRLFLPSQITHYANVKNLQNRTNAYVLTLGGQPDQ